MADCGRVFVLGVIAGLAIGWLLKILEERNG